MIFSQSAPNRLLLSPRISESEKMQMQLLQAGFEKRFGPCGYFLVPSSGSSQKQDESAKLIALSVQAVLNSAARFNAYFGVRPEDHWGLVLPEFHVAGIGVQARAFLNGARVFSSEWKVSGIKNWLEENAVALLSVVPAQLYDLVQGGVRSPAGLKKVFVGGGALGPGLREQALSLGWPLTETYGMTETASMIAVRGSSGDFQVLPGVEVRLNAGQLEIRCNSLLTASLQLRGGQVVLNENESEWYLTSDRAEIRGNELKFLGRAGDYVKILGEGVSLPELKSRLEKLADPRLFEIVAVEDQRAGFVLILVCEASMGAAAAQSLLSSHNQTCRPYEKIARLVTVESIPRSELGKLKTEHLKRIIG